jgi:hypothetical protein
VNSYLIAIAGNDREIDGETFPSEIDITTIPEPFWPLFHTMFGVDTLTFKYFYTPVDEAVPDFDAAVQYSKDHEDDLKQFIPAGEWRDVLRYRKVLQRMVKVMNRLGGVIAIGVVEDA